MIYKEFEDKLKIAYQNLKYDKEDKGLYRIECRKIDNEFHEALKKKYGYNIPKQYENGIWNYCYENYHCSGYSEIEINYSELINYISEEY